MPVRPNGQKPYDAKIIRNRLTLTVTPHHSCFQTHSYKRKLGSVIWWISNQISELLTGRANSGTVGLNPHLSDFLVAGQAQTKYLFPEFNPLGGSGTVTLIVKGHNTVVQAVELAFKRFTKCLVGRVHEEPRNAAGNQGFAPGSLLIPLTHLAGNTVPE